MKRISWNAAILIACIIIIFLASGKYEGTMSVLDEGKRTATYEEFKTFILEGDGKCSPGERRDSVDCQINLNFDNILGCIWDKDVKCESPFVTGIILLMAVVILFFIIGGKNQRRK